MNSKICSVCKKKFNNESKPVGKNSDVHSNCKQIKKSKQKKEMRRMRTSTPVAEIENSPSTSFSDSVSDFFYQSWKSGLHADESKALQTTSRQNNQQPYVTAQPFCYTPQVIFVNTVIYQPYLPVQQIGYRSDGTFGVLPMYWFYNSN